MRLVVETRTRVSPTRFRIPECCVVSASHARERTITTPPLLCVEVLSPRDSLKAMRRRVQDFFDMGVLTIWIFDPERRIAYDCAATSMTEHSRSTFRVAGTAIEVAIEDVIATLDE